MKAAVLHKFGRAPRYEDFPDPTIEDGEILIQVKAVALENFDRAMARGSHYAMRQFLPHLPAIVGSDGIVVSDDGRLIGFGGMKPRMVQWLKKRLFQHCTRFLSPMGSTPRRLRRFRVRH
jgi:NADPH2:quinone reductase